MHPPQVEALPEQWHPTRNAEVHSYLYLPEQSTLQIRFRSNPDKIYDFPCDVKLYQRFRASRAQDRFVEEVLRPHAEQMGWTDLARAHRGASPAPKSAAKAAAQTVKSE